MSFIKFLVGVTIFLLSNFTFAQNNLTQFEIDSIYKNVLEGGLKQDFLKFTRLTSENEIASCEIEFQKIVSYTRNAKKEIHVVKGSLNSHYFKEKYQTVVSLKVNPLKLIEEKLNTEEVWQKQKPYFSTIIYSGTNLNQFKYADFECETGGSCIAYSDDKKLKMSEALTNFKNNNTKIIFNFEKGSYDRVVDLTKISKDFEDIRLKFAQCHLEILDKIAKEIKELK